MISVELAIVLFERVLRAAAEWLQDEPEITVEEINARIDQMFERIRSDESAEWAEVHRKHDDEIDTTKGEQ